MTLQRVELTSEDMVFLIVGMLMLSVVGMKFVPLFKSSRRSGRRLMSVKLWILLLEVSFSFSASSRDFWVRLFSISRRRAVFCCQRLILDTWSSFFPCALHKIGKNLLWLVLPQAYHPLFVWWTVL